MNTSENGNGGGPAKKPTVHAGPSRRFTLADVAAVATGAALLEIEPAALEALPSVPPDASAPVALRVAVLGDSNCQMADRDRPFDEGGHFVEQFFIQHGTTAERSRFRHHLFA